MNKFILPMMIASVLLSTNAMGAFSIHVDRSGGGPYFGAGGEYTITPNGPIPDIPGPWQTFCLERNEHIMPPYDAYFDNFETYTVLGGINGQDTITPDGLFADSLDFRTAYLFTQFSMGTLSNYNNDPASAGAFQAAIWLIEDEITAYSDVLSDPGMIAQAQSWVAMAENEGWTDLGNVRVVNLYTLASDVKIHHQSQLVMTPIPAPGAILLGSIGVCLVGWIGRKRMI